MHKFVRNLITEWRRLGLPHAGEIVLVASSGGADSTALLLALSDLKKRKKLAHAFVAAHFNHKLRGKESDEDEAFVRYLATENDIEFVAGSGRITGTADIEQRARIERYKFFAKAAKQKNAGLVLTAHTMNDQAETVLMNLIRGAGLDGLCGMKKIRTLEADTALQLVRPILGWAKREDTEGFCNDLGIAPRIDEMNDDPRFTRVRIRRSVIPMLAQINPKIVETLARNADLIDSAGHRKNDVPTGSIRLGDLSDLSRNELYSHIRAWLKENRGNTRGLQLKHIEAVARLVNSPKSGRIVELPGGDTVAKHGGRLDFRHIKLEN